MRGIERKRPIIGTGLGVLAVLFTVGCSFNASIGDAGPAEDGGAESGESGAPESGGGSGGGADDNADDNAGGGAGGDAASVPADEVAQQAASVLEEQVGQAPDDLTCPEDLPAEVGSTIRCDLTAGGQTLGVTITTTSVEGTDVNFDVEVDEQPSG